MQEAFNISEIDEKDFLGGYRNSNQKFNEAHSQGAPSKDYEDQKIEGAIGGAVEFDKEHL